MIDYIKGTIAETGENSVVIEANGIGYGLIVSAATISRMSIGAQETLYTHMSVREDGVSLFGFYSKHEKAMFSRLITVSGIGPKMAVTILGGIGVDDLAALIAGGDYGRLCSIKGVGKKTAERIVLELKDSLVKEFGKPEFAGDNLDGMKKAEEAILALMSMGFSKQEASLAVSGCGVKDLASVEEIILAALKKTK